MKTPVEGKLSEPELNRVLTALGLRLEASNREQLSTMLDALVIFDEKNKRYNDAWQQEGAIDSAHHCKSKAVRINQELHRKPEEIDLDDGYDGINYFCFYVRNVLDDNRGVIDE